MSDLDAEDGRNFQGLGPREAQSALADEWGGAMDEAEDDDIEETNAGDGASAAAPAEDNDQQAENPVPAEIPAAAVWAEEELAEQARMVEALLFAAMEPLDERAIAERLPVGADVKALLERIKSDYESRGVQLRRVGEKWRFATAPDVAHVLEKERAQPRKLSRAALETLAVIAYHQPCTRADIEDVRGVAVAKGSLDQLLEIGWVRLRGKRRDAPGRPTLYGTTDAFLEHFGLEQVEDLPGLADLKAAGLLDARLPPGFAVPTPSGDDDEGEVEADDGSEETEFARDFLDDDRAEDG